ncbi:uncharacterized protein [Amphiura filiformis]|uniref:uncharacterized protein n=1 Tax=Amphiura filiformis TaxID=82378 RepID=UPI003B2162C7
MAKQTPIFHEFDAQDGDVECYLDQLQQYFIAMDIEDNDENANKRRAILLSSVGTDVYQTLRDLSYPQQPSGKTYKQLTDMMKNHYRPQRLVVAERFRFHSTKQASGQSITDYSTQLKKMAAFCEFVGDQLEQNLRDRFICGLQSENTQRKLLSRNYTFKEAVDMALAEEAALKDVRDMSARGQGSVNKIGKGNQYHNNRYKKA